MRAFKEACDSISNDHNSMNANSGKSIAIGYSRIKHNGTPRE